MDQKKTDYGNWVPLALMKRLAAIAGALLAGEVLLIVLDGPTALTLLVGGLLAAAVILWLYMLRCRVLFDFNRGGLMGQVHQYLTDHLPWDGRGTLLDIGCGSGALTIRCAKRFPNASLVGVDYWGAAWSYAKEQCQQNAAAGRAAEGIVGQADKFIVVLGIRTETAQADRHAALKVPVQLGLGPVVFLKIMKELFGGAGESQFLGTALEVFPYSFNFLHRGLFTEGDKHSGGMAIRYRHP
mgnify:CR=1 FL=1